MIYLLHSTATLGGTGQHSARHYLGWCKEENLHKRVLEHRGGISHVAIVTAFLAAGGKLLLVACLPGGTRKDERSLKNAGHLARLCPLCSEKEIVVGWPSGLIALIPRRGQSLAPWQKRKIASGGGSPRRSTTPATSPSGASPRAPYPASITPSGDDAPDRATGGTSWTATVPPSPAVSTPPVGTRPPCSSATNGSTDE